MQRTNGTFKLQDVCVSGSDDHVLAVQRFGATVDGEERFLDATSVMHFSDGRQKERWFHPRPERVPEHPHQMVLADPGGLSLHQAVAPKPSIRSST